jgi:diadenosine tetraphosphatase ApaH/serine/threonine PP2A family protein phosphatase
MAPVLQPLCGKAEDRSELVAKLAEHPLAAQFEANRKALCAGLGGALFQAICSESRNVGPSRHGGERIAVIADVHANIEALEAVLQEAKSLGVDGYVFAGDAVGYGPNPRECVQRLAELPNARYVRGNHDHAIGTGIFSVGMNGLARSCADWTRTQLSADERQWLLALPVELRESEWLAVHGAPKDSKRFLAYVYELTFQDNLEHLAMEDLELCFCGHTHVQFVHERTAAGQCRKLGSPPRVPVGAQRVLIVNPGSVGQPRDHDRRAAFAVWDRRERAVHLHRVPYDVEAVTAAIRASDLPSDLGKRLLEGQ